MNQSNNSFTIFSSGSVRLSETSSTFIIAVFLFGLALYSYALFFSLLALLAVLFGLSRVRGSNRILRGARGFASLAFSFLGSQLFLFYALVLWVSGHSLHVWQKVEDVRKEWKAEQLS